ncbi:efflux transporter outer membrane subunit [Myxococcota bacterium]|nr:efflux transporter outer membrane subunit [Myxococcota bacterium]
MAIVLLQASCAIGPNYQRPQVETPETYRAAVGAPEAASYADLPWWKVFRDPDLLALIETAIQNNLDVQMAVARTEQAYRQSAAVRSAFYPQVGYEGSASRSQSARFLDPGTPLKSTSYGGALNAVWEIDLWGRIRRASEAAQAELLASEDYQRGILLSLVANVASLYFTLLELDRSHDIATEAVASYETVMELFLRKFEGGVASRLQLTRATAARAEAAAWIPTIEIEIAAIENQLSVLLGLPPESIVRNIALRDQHLPKIPYGLPSELMERRPDIRLAEQGVISSNAQVGVAMGNFLPRVGLVTMWGGASSDLSGIGSGSTTLWNVAGQLSGPIFKGGLLYAEYKAQVAAWEEAKANYELTALNAFAEVSSKLVENQHLHEQRTARETQVDQLKQSVELSMTRYQQGLANYFEVLEAQQYLYPAEFDLAQTRRDQHLAFIDLYRALGGGWQLGLDWSQPPDPTTATPSDPKTAPPGTAPNSTPQTSPPSTAP